MVVDPIFLLQWVVVVDSKESGLVGFLKASSMMPKNLDDEFSDPLKNQNVEPYTTEN